MGRRGKNPGDRRQKECGACNELGTKSCSEGVNECVCEKGYRGNFCELCQDPLYFFGPEGCQVCPCPLARSDGTCKFDSSLGKAVCSWCRPAFGGYECNQCAAKYLPANETCVLADPRSLDASPDSAASPALVAGMAVSVLGIFLLAVCLLFFIYRYHRRSSARRLGMCREDKFLLADREGVTLNGAFSIEEDPYEFDEDYDSTGIRMERLESNKPDRASYYYLSGSEGQGERV